MKRLFIHINICLMLYSLISCNKATRTWQNKEFETSINSYIGYADSVRCKNDFDYIYIEATKYQDSTVFIMCLSGGAYFFLNKQDKIINFFTYKKYDIMLTGDFPNGIVNIERNKNLNIIKDIVKVRYPIDYNKYLKDIHSVAPLIYDYMNMTLTFKNDKLVSCKRQYY